MAKTKPFDISKRAVWEAYQRVRKNQGAPGVDGVTIKDFEDNLKDNLYKIWNRMSSGSYIPKAVLIVGIPKKNGRTRKLGIPTVEDRVAQMVVKMCLEERIEPVFHKWSYGYRKNKSAHDALEKARKNCWKYGWVIDLDIKEFFDSIDHELMMKAVRKHVTEKWMLLYIERWLKAPAREKGKERRRSKGTPQGGVISPLLANLFLHYALDKWMERKYPDIVFERYADDIIIHCNGKATAGALREEIKERLKECKLEMNSAKTKIVYCKDSGRHGNHENEAFSFLGYTFRPRLAKSKAGKIFVSFSPAISSEAVKSIRAEIRIWKLGRATNKTLEEIAEFINPKVRGWINYYSKYYKSELYPILKQIDLQIAKWSMRKYKRLRGSWFRSRKWLRTIAKREPNLLVIWQPGVMPAAGW